MKTHGPRRIADALQTALPSRTVGLEFVAKPTCGREFAARLLVVVLGGLALAAIGLWWPS